MRVERHRTGRRRWMVLATWLALSSATASCASADSDGGSTSTVPCGGHSTVAYAAHDGVDPGLTSLDVYRPAADRGRCTRRALVVWVHGGAWHEGDKTDHIDDKVALFNGAGDVFASVNYRLTDDALDPPAPRYPVHDQDVADAIAWLLDHADAYGIDPARVAVLGHSAGGGIVAAIATDDRYLAEHHLGLDAIGCAGSIDGEGYDVTVGATHPDPRVHEPYLDAFGSDPAVWRTASPLTHIAADKGIADWFVAIRGPAGRLDLHHRFVAALEAAHVPTTTYDASALDHAQVSTNIGAPGDTTVTPALTAFLDTCLAGRHGR